MRNQEPRTWDLEIRNLETERFTGYENVSREVKTMELGCSPLLVSSALKLFSVCGGS